MNIKYNEGETVVVSEEFMERAGVSRKGKGEIIKISTGGDSQEEPIYAIDFENFGHTIVLQSEIIGYEGEI